MGPRANFFEGEGAAIDAIGVVLRPHNDYLLACALSDRVDLISSKAFV
jgi:hypothetical protein